MQNRYARRGKAQQTRFPITPSGTTTVTLTEDQMQAEYLDIATGATGGWVLQIPVTPKDMGMMWLIRNASGQTCTVKGYTADGGTTPTTGATIATAKINWMVWDGTDFIAATGP
jgi:hypothetical protein